MKAELHGDKVTFTPEPREVKIRPPEGRLLKVWRRVKRWFGVIEENRRWK